MGSLIKSWFEAFLNLVYPRNLKCMICDETLLDTETNCLCETCGARLIWLTENNCVKCGRHIGLVSTVNTCYECKNEQRAYSKNCSMVLYNDDVKKLIYKLKYGDQRYIAYHMGNIMVEGLAEMGYGNENIDLIIPVPLHTTRLGERGFNQSEWIGKQIAKRMQIHMSPLAVKRIRYTEPQTLLNRAARLQNLKGAFQVNDEVQIVNKRILVVDDVFTTGSTLNEVSYELVRMGAAHVITSTFAAANVRD